MAGGRLTYNQVAAPDLSSTSRILAAAGASFDSGMESAKDLLGTYQKGQQSTADNAILGEIAKLSSEDELNAYLAGNTLNNRNLSPEMRETILGLRSTVLGYGQDRATTDSTIAGTEGTRARTGILQAAEGRTAAEYTDSVNARNERRSLTPLMVGAAQEGLTNGTAFSAAIDRTESGGGADQYDTLFGHRNRENGVQVSQMTLGEVKEFSSTSGAYGQSVKNEIGRVATPMGKFQIVGTTLRNIQNDLDLPDTVQFNPQVQELMGTYLGQQRVMGPRSAQNMRDGLRAEWEGFKNKSDAELDVIIGELRSMPPVSREDIIAAGSGGGAVPPRVTQNQRGGPANDALVRAISASLYQDPDTALGMLNTARQYQNQGQTELDAANARRAQGITDAEILRQSLAYDNTSAEQVTQDVIRNGSSLGLNPSEVLAAAGRANTEVGNLGSVIAPTSYVDPMIAATIAADNEAGQRGIDALPQTRMLERSSRFESNPTQGLIDELGLGADGEDPRSYVFGLFGERADNNTITQTINDIAQQAGVTPAMAASGMAEMFRRDPTGPNTVDRRFRPEETVAFIKETMSPEAMRRYDSEKLSQTNRSAQFQRAELEMSILRTQVQKLPIGSPERQRLEQQLEQQSQAVLANIPPEEANRKLEDYVRKSGMGSRLQGLDPESADFERAIRQLEETIKADSSLTSTEKTLLIGRLPR